MKYFYSFILLLFVNSLMLAQVSEQSTTMSLGNNNAFTVDLPGADKKLAEKMLKEYLKDYGKVEKNKKAKEYYVTQTRVPAIETGGLVNLYAKIEEGKDMAMMTLWVDNGSSFVSSDEIPSEARGVEVFLTDYRNIVVKEVIKNELKDEEDNLEDLEKDLKKLGDKNEDYHKDIAKANEKIAEAEQNIEKNLMERDAKQEEINKQKQLLENVADRLNNVGRDN